MKPFPLIINDVVRVDCCRIKRVLAEDDLICSDDQAEQLRTALKTLPVNDCDLIRLLRRFVSINWELYPYLVEPTFRD